MLKGAADDDRDIYHLNDGERLALQDLVDEHYDRPSNWASNLLCAVYGSCRPPHTGGGGNEKSTTGPRRRGTAPMPASLLVHPNPTNSWAAIDYALPASGSVARLLVRDISGRVVDEFTMAGEQGQVVWDTRRTAPGVYSVELLREGRLLGAARVVVQP